jgi:activator of HSP90 ATPase
VAASFTISATFPVSPETLYKAWLSSKEHSAFTGSPAKISTKTGGKFAAWDDYINGTTIELVKGKKIVQRWRTTEFSENDPDSLVEISLAGTAKGAILTLTHSQIPKGQAQSYKKGWEDFYFAPMREYFRKAAQE